MDIVWTFQHPDTGGYEGPYSTANLRDLFATGYITSNIMVHDEEAGISTKLFTLLGYSSLADGGAGGTPEEEDAPLQDFIPLQGNATLNHMQNLPVGAGVDDEEARWSPVVHRTQPANDWRSEAANAELERRNAHGGDRREELSSWERATRWEAQAEDHQPADIARHSSGGGDGYGFVSHMAVPGQHVGERHAGFGNAYDRYQEQYNQQEYQRGPAQSAYDPHANQAPVSHVNSYSNGGPVPRPMAPHQVGHQAHTRPMVPMRHGPRPMMADQSQTVLPGNAAYDGVELPQPEPQQQARPHNDRKRERERSASFQSHRRNGKWDSEKRSPRHEFTRRWDNSRDRGRDRDRDRDRDHGRHWEREQDKMPDRRKERPREGPKDGYRPPPRSDTHRYRRR